MYEVHKKVRMLVGWAARNRYDIKITYDEQSIRVWQYYNAGFFTDVDLAFVYIDDLDHRGMNMLKKQIEREIHAIRNEIGNGNFAAL